MRTGNDEQSVKARQELARRVEAEAKRREEQAAEETKAREKKARMEEVIRSFAMKESPVLWQTVEALRTRVESQKERIKGLRYALTAMGENPDVDEDVRFLEDENDRLLIQMKEAEEKLKAAYLDSVKFRLTRGAEEKDSFNQEADGAGEDASEGIESRYDEMRRSK